MEANSAVSRVDGISESELAGLADFEQHGGFSQLERAALAYAVSVTTANSVADPVFERLQRHFDEDQIVELTAVITWEICAAKFNRALEIEGQGICLLPLELVNRENPAKLPG